MKSYIKLINNCLAASIVVWLFVRLTYFKEVFFSYKLIYWLLPTLIVLVIYLIRQLKKSIFIGLLVALLAETNLVFALIKFCESDKNPSFWIESLVIGINMLILGIVIYRARLLEKKSQLMFWAALLATNAFMLLFYEYSIYRLYDSIFYAVFQFHL